LLRRGAFALLLATAAVPFPAAAQERWESFRDDASGLFGIFGGDREQSRRTAQSDQSPVYAQGGPGELSVRLDRLENQLRQLTGSIEQLQFRNQQLEQQLRRTQEDMEFRFQEATGKTTPGRPRAAPPTQGTPPAAAPGPAPGRRSDVFDPAAQPNAPGTPQTLGAIAAAPPVAGGPPPVILEEEPGVGAPGGRPAGAPLDLSRMSERPAREGEQARPGPPMVAALPGEPQPGALPAPPPRNPNATGAPQQTVMAPSATPKDEFALAHGYIQRKDYALAEDSLRAFLKKHPSDRLVSDAHYWLGESLYQRQRYRDAAESFLAVSTKFEKSAKAPDSLLRLGQSLAALGEREAACATLGEVGRKYPGASAGVKQSVDREQKRAKC
jgi:tol-pal system protein YbgF